MILPSPNSQGLRGLKRYVGTALLRSFFTTANPDRGKERYRRAGLTASSSFISQALNIAISLVSVPLTVHYLGTERYGVWLTISSLLMWMAMSDFGLAGNALVNVIAEAHGKEDKELARQYAASALWTLTAITSVLSVIFISFFNRIPWRTVFRVSSAVSNTELHNACALALGLLALTFPLNMLNSVYNAYQEGVVANLWTIASNILALLALITVTRLRGGLPHLIFAISGVRVLVNFANAYYLFFRRYPWLSPGFSAVRWSRVKRLGQLGSKYMLTQLASLGIYQSQPMIITQVLGPSYVLIFVVSQKILSLPNNLVYMATTPLISAYSEAMTRGNWTWIKGALRNSILASIGFGILTVLPIALAAKPLIHFWAGANAVPDTHLLLWLVIYGLLSIAVIPVGQMLCGVDRVGALALAVSVCSVTTIAFTLLFVHWWNLAGMAFGMSLAVVLTLVPSMAFETARLLRRPDEKCGPISAEAAGLKFSES